MSVRNPVCPTGCNSILPQASSDLCNPTIVFGEIEKIYIAAGDVEPFTDWTDVTEWEARLSDIDVVDQNKIRTLVVIGDHAAAQSDEITISLGRKVHTPATYTINFDIDDISDLNYEFSRTTSCNTQYRIWFANKQRMFGGNDGILASVSIRPVIERGIKSINKLSGSVSWESDFAPESADSVFQAIVGDNNPQWKSLFYFEVNEGSTLITTIMATDPNSLPLKYFIYQGFDGDKFKINENTGVLEFIVETNFDNPADLDDDNLYEVLVKVINSAGNFIIKRVYVQVKNVNIIELDINLSSDSIPEDSPVNTVVGSFDCPEIVNPVTYTIDNTYGDYSSFWIDGNELKTLAIFDFETKKEYLIRVTGTDGISTETKIFSIYITNVIEGPVDIIMSKNTIMEGNSIGDVICSMTLVNQEFAAGVPNFELITGDGDTDNDSFYIDGGYLKANESFNFETQNIYSIRVFGSNTTGSTEKILIIFITNVDEAPVITSSASFVIPENTTAVGTIAAVDQEGEQVNYTIVGGVDRWSFVLDQFTGNLISLTVPNFEIPHDIHFDGSHDNIYELVVQATDQSGLFVTQAITVRVTDVDENEVGWYVSPTGLDANPGTYTYPFKTLNKALQLASPGETIFMRGGVHELQNKLTITKSGTAGNTINIFAYGSEKPSIIKGSSFPANTNGIEIIADYLYFKNVEVSGFIQTSNVFISAIYVWGTNGSTFERMNVHHNGNGMVVRGDGIIGNPVGSTNNLILNSDFHHNYDPYTNDGAGAYGNADGLGMQFFTRLSDNNSVIGCRFYNNSDDGIDFDRNDGYVTIKNCWSFNNGYREDGSTPGGDGNGFKLGLPSGVNQSDIIKVTVENCIAANNKYWGFTENNIKTRVHFVNNTAYNNSEGGIHLYGAGGDIQCTVKNNISYKNHSSNPSYQHYLSPSSVIDHNSWQVATVNDSDFESLLISEMSAERKPDGSLPDISCLRLAAGSDLIDAGTNVGLPYKSLPDIGAVEYDDGTEWIINRSPVFTNPDTTTVISGNTSVITLTVNDVTGTAITFTKTGGSDIGLFIVNPVTGSVSFINPVYFGGDNSYELIVSASNAEGYVAYQTLAITVLQSLNDGLISYYKLENLNDSVGGNNLSASGDATLVTGKNGNCYQFSGTGYLSAGDQASLELTYPFSISFCINAASISTEWQPLITKINSNDTNGFAVWLSNADIYLETANNATSANGGYLTVLGAVNTWYHIVITFDGTSVKGYLNAIAGTVRTNTLIPTHTNNPFLIASVQGDGGNGFFSGKIDEVGIWNRVLSQTEITTMYNSGTIKTYPF